MRVRQIIPKEKLEALNTRRLMGVLKAIRECHETQDEDAYGTIDEYKARPYQKLTKDTPEWKAYYQLVKSILDQRENISTRAKIRRQVRKGRETRHSA